MLADIASLMRAARTLGLQSFGETVFQWLGSAIQFDCGAMITSSIAAPNLRDAHLHHLPPEMLYEWEKVAHLNAAGRMLFQHPGKALTDCLPSGVYSEPEFAPIRELLDRYGMRQSLGIAIPQSCGSLCSVLSVHRGDIGKPFSDGETQHFERIAPMLVEAWALNRIICAGRLLGRQALEGPMALIGSDGVILHAMEGWTNLVFGQADNDQNPSVPRRLLESPLGVEVEWDDGAYYATREAAGDGYLIRLRPRKASDMLGRREREVAQLYASGLSYKEVAQSLKLSPNTVRNHIQNAFRKLDASSRVQLTQRLSPPQ